MRNKRADTALIQDMIDSCDAILEYTAGLTLESFLKDKKTIDATIRRFITLGEASSQITKEFRERYKSLPWRQASDLRNILVHFYHGASLDVVWTTVNQIIPQLRGQLETVLKAEIKHSPT